VWRHRLGLKLGVLDFAGGTVVHINAGIAGLMCALVLGKRVGYAVTTWRLQCGLRRDRCVLLWWLVRVQRGLRGWRERPRGHGDDGHPDRDRRGGLGWMFAEWITKGKPSVLGAISARLPASWRSPGFRLRAAGRLDHIGVAAGVICFWSATSLKHMLVTTTAWTRSACMVLAESSAPY